MPQQSMTEASLGDVPHVSATDFSLEPITSEEAFSKLLEISGENQSCSYWDYIKNQFLRIKYEKKHRGC